MPQNDHSGGEEDHVLEHYFRSQDSKTDAMPAPPTDSPTPMQHSNHETQQSDEGGDYFLYKLHLLEHQEKQRQQVLDAMAPVTLNRSRWSESTIQSIDMDETAIDDDDDEEEETDDDDQHSVLEMAVPERQIPVRQAASWQNFSYKRDPLTPASPRRPPIKTMDSVDDFIKRGGWKRRGIVFQNEDVRSESSMF